MNKFMDILFVVRKKNYDLVNDVLEKNIFNRYGFFLCSLKIFSNIYVYSDTQFLNKLLNDKFDHIIIDCKCFSKETNNELSKKIKILNLKVSILSYIDEQSKFINLLKIIIHYNLKSQIKNIFVMNVFEKNSKTSKFFSKKTGIKIVSTHYGTGGSSVLYDMTKQAYHFNYKKKADPQINSIFYSGSISNRDKRNSRIHYIQDLSKLNIPNKRIIFFDQKNQELLRLSDSDYIYETLNSEINIVLPGQFDNITYRFYEVNILNKFYLIDKHFLGMSISKLYKNLNDFVFHNINDLKSKINFYLNNPDKRLLVQTQQQFTFRNFYNISTHGKQIRNYFK